MAYTSRAGLAVGRADGELELWNLETPLRVTNIRAHEGPIPALLSTKNADWVVTGGGDGVVKVWQVESGTLVKELTQSGGLVLAVVVDREGRHLAAAGAKGVVTIWSVGQDWKATTFQASGEAIRALAFRPGVMEIAVAGADGAVALWDLQTKKPIGTLGKAKNPIRSLAFRGDGRELAAAGGDRVVQVFEVQAMHEKATLRGSTAEILALAYNPEGSSLASADASGSVLFWNGTPESISIPSQDAASSALVFSPGGDFVMSSNTEHEITLRDVSRGRLVEAFGKQTDHVLALDASEDGRWVASGGNFADVNVWDLKSEKRLVSIPHEEAATLSLAFDGSSKRIAAGFGSPTLVLHGPFGKEINDARTPGSLEVWSLPAGELKWSQPSLGGPVQQCAFDPSGKTVAAIETTGFVSIHDGLSGATLKRFQAHERYGLRARLQSRRQGDCDGRSRSTREIVGQPIV